MDRLVFSWFYFFFFFLSTQCWGKYQDYTFVPFSGSSTKKKKPLGKSGLSICVFILTLSLSLKETVSYLTTP